jgi:uncharacterized protein YndB with AHSA1/START domain
MSTLEQPVSETEVFRLTRVFDAPEDVLWKAWTDPEHLAKWWGPAGMQVIIKEMDFKAGGRLIYGMQGPMGIMWGRFVYRLISEPNLLAYVVSFTNDKGEPIRHPMVGNWPLEVLTVQTFDEVDGKTTMESRAYPINATPEERAIFTAGHAGMQMGFAGTLAQLEVFLTKQKVEQS